MKHLTKCKGSYFRSFIFTVLEQITANPNFSSCLLIIKEAFWSFSAAYFFSWRLKKAVHGVFNLISPSPYLNSHSGCITHVRSASTHFPFEKLFTHSK